MSTPTVRFVAMNAEPEAHSSPKSSHLEDPKSFK